MLAIFVTGAIMAYSFQEAISNDDPVWLQVWNLTNLCLATLATALNILVYVFE